MLSHSANCRTEFLSLSLATTLNAACSAHCLTFSFMVVESCDVDFWHKKDSCWPEEETYQRRIVGLSHLELNTEYNDTTGNR